VTNFTAGSSSAEVAQTNITDELDTFIKWLQVTLGGPVKEQPKVKKMNDIIVRYREFLDMLDDLHEKGWGWALGGFQVPEGQCITALQMLYLLPIQK
jgi:hypothetical protein